MGAGGRVTHKSNLSILKIMLSPENYKQNPDLGFKITNTHMYS